MCFPRFPFQIYAIYQAIPVDGLDLGDSGDPAGAPDTRLVRHLVWGSPGGCL